MEHVRARISLIFAWIVLQLKNLVRPTDGSRRPSPPLIHGGEKHFTVLGAQHPAVQARRRITELFPIANSNDRSAKLPHQG